VTKLRQVYVTRLLFLLTIIVCFGCSSPTKKVDERIRLDTLSFGQKDYDSMREYFTHDSLFMAALNQKISAGDSNAIKVKILLNTPFDLRRNAGIDETEIYVAIRSYYLSKEVTNKFSEIDRTLLMADTATIGSETDSILESIDKQKSTLKQN
jgi:hypothetical protein